MSMIMFQFGMLNTKFDIKQDCTVIRKVKKKAKIRNRYNEVPHLTQDTIVESDKNTRKHHEQASQEVSSFLALISRNISNKKS